MLLHSVWAACAAIVPAPAVLSTRAQFLATALLSSSSIQVSLPESGCPLNAPPNLREAASTIRSAVRSSIRSDPTLAGPLLRLAFHDATTLEYGPRYLSDAAALTCTGGPNGSVRYELDDRYENRALARPLGLVHTLLTETCNKVTLADAIALAGATAVETAGGPHIPIRLGRPDAPSADPIKLRVPIRKSTERSRVETTLPSAGLDSVGLRLYFGRLGLTEEEMVALSGAHDLGRHVTLTGMSRECLKNLTRECLEDAPVSVPFVSLNPDTFSNEYYKALLRWYDRKVELGEVAFLPTDVALVVDNGLRRHVDRFSHDEHAFFKVFARAFQKLVDSTATTVERF